MDDVSVENKNQTRKNLLFNILGLLANILVGIFYTPFLVRQLGIVAYGVLPLVLVINQYISVLTGSLTSSLTRFYSIAIQQERLNDASKCINTALGVVFIIFLILLLPLCFIVSDIDNIFTIPIDLIEQAQFLFIFTITSFFLSLISSVFNITLYAKNRLDSLNIIKIIRVSLKFGFIVLLFSCLGSNLIYIGYANLLTEIVVLIFSIYAFRKISRNDVKVNLKYFDKATLFSMLTMTIWVMIIQLGDTGLYRIDSVVINIFWSTKESGILGAFTELGSYVMTSLGVISSIFGPLILIAYSKNKHKEVERMAIDQSLIVGVIAAVISGLIIGFSIQIARIWLGEGFESFSPWLVLKIILIPFYTASGVFSFIYRAWNRVKVPAILTLLLGGVNLAIAIIIAKTGNQSYNSILLILGTGSLLGIIQSYIMTGWYITKIYPSMKSALPKNFILTLFVLIFASSFSYAVNIIFPFNGIIRFLIVGSITFLICFGIVFNFVFNNEQKAYLYSFIKIR